MFTKKILATLTLSVFASAPAMAQNVGRDLDRTIQYLERAIDELRFEGDQLDALSYMRDADELLERYSNQDPDLYRAENLNDDAVRILRDIFINEETQNREAVRNLDRAIMFIENSALYLNGGGGVIPNGPNYVGSFVQPNGSASQVTFNIRNLTAHRGYSQIRFDVEIRQQFAPIINTIKVNVNGQWIQSTFGVRLNQGVNILNLNVPAGATEITFKPDHGMGSETRVYLQ